MVRTKPPAKKKLIRTKLPVQRVKNPGSKPVKWNGDRSRQAYELSLLGLTDEQMANVMGVHLRTLEYWYRTKPAFERKVKEGKDLADARVARSLIERACGYSHPDVHIVKSSDDKIIITPITKHYPPDTTACIYWLGNRQRALWQSVNRTEHSGNVGITHYQPLDLSIFSEKERKLLESANTKQLPIDGIRNN